MSDFFKCSMVENGVKCTSLTGNKEALCDYHLIITQNANISILEKKLTQANEQLKDCEYVIKGFKIDGRMGTAIRVFELAKDYFNKYKKD